MAEFSFELGRAWYKFERDLSRELFECVLGKVRAKRVRAENDIRCDLMEQALLKEGKHDVDDLEQALLAKGKHDDDNVDC